MYCLRLCALRPGDASHGRQHGNAPVLNFHGAQVLEVLPGGRWRLEIAGLVSGERFPVQWSRFTCNCYCWKLQHFHGTLIIQCKTLSLLEHWHVKNLPGLVAVGLATNVPDNRLAPLVLRCKPQGIEKAQRSAHADLIRLIECTLELSVQPCVHIIMSKHINWNLIIQAIVNKQNFHIIIELTGCSAGLLSSYSFMFFDTSCFYDLIGKSGIIR